MKKFRLPYHPIPDINITALVDVMLVLLIIFMVTAPMLRSALDIEIPKAAHAMTTVEEGIEINIRKDGTIYIDKTPVPVEQFEIAFQQVFAPASHQPVFLWADQEVPYRDVLRVIDVLRGAGVQDLGLVAEPLIKK
ncbi:MAG: biopolymer transporter ExbD [bacterium]